MFEILDSLIATIVVILILSLIVQSIQQIIKQIFSLKSKYMERELFSMFQGQPYNNNPFKIIINKIKDIFFPIMFKFYQAKTDSPDYSEIVKRLKTSISTLGYNDLSLLETIKKEDFEKILSSIDLTGLNDTANQKLIKIKTDIENWYDITIKSFQDHYERRMKLWSYILASLVVIWLNANIFSIYQEFSTDKVVRENAIKFGEHIQKPSRNNTQDSLETKIDSTINNKNSSTKTDTAKNNKSSSTKTIDTTNNNSLSKSDSLELEQINRNISDINKLVNNNSFQIMRWNVPKGDSLHWKDGERHLTISAAINDFCKAIMNNFWGWLAMVLLVGLGAPFWYDFLQTILGAKEKLKKNNQDNT